MTLSEELAWRGFINQTTLSDPKKLDSGAITFYTGYDAASEDSLTIGNLAVIMMDRCFVRHGHKAVVLAGGATSLIGDPGGKDSERQLQPADEVAGNIDKVSQQLRRLLGGQAEIVNNLDWFGDMKLLDFLRDIGKHFSMTPLVQRDYIAKRMGEGGTGISYTEFSYTLLQGYDFLRLYKDHGVTLQLAGADQWGNSLSGVDLVRRVTGKEVNILTCSLVVNKATGKKFGKTEDGAVWLDPARTSPTSFYQYWINVDDDGVESYLKLYTELDKQAIDQIMAEHRENPGVRLAQKRLAEAVTMVVHGAEATSLAQAVTEYLTGSRAVANLDEAFIKEVKTSIPAVKSPAGGAIIEALIGSGLADSKTEAKRLLAGNAISVNHVKVDRQNFEADDFNNGVVLLRKGKKFKDTALVELE